MNIVTIPMIEGKWELTLNLDFEPIDLLVHLISQVEGFSAVVYKDSGGVLTIGFGTTIIDGKPLSVKQAPITKERALALLKEDIAIRAIAVEALIKVPLTDLQQAAVLCLVYNIGINAFKTSTVLKRINSKDTQDAITEAWNRFTKGTIPTKKGLVRKDLPGLVDRRRAEAALYFYGQNNDKQAV